MTKLEGEGVLGPTSEAVLLVFDVTNRKSFSELPAWLEDSRLCVT